MKNERQSAEGRGEGVSLLHATAADQAGQPRSIAARCPNRRVAGGAVVAVLGCAALALVVGGCGPKFGAMLYFLGGGQGPKVPAEYTLPAGPMLILVDDDWDLVHPRTACDALVDALATELTKYKLADRVTTNEELARLRQTEPNFDKRGAREVGRLAKADVVIWLKVVRFSLQDDLEMAHQAGRFGVTLKVINANAENRDEVALWPSDREGRLIEIKVSAHEIRACGKLADAHALLAERLAVEIAKLFREYQEDHWLEG